MSIAAPATYRWHWIAIILLTAALVVTTTLTIVYATSDSSEGTGHSVIPVLSNTHECYRPAVPC